MGIEEADKCVLVFNRVQICCAGRRGLRDHVAAELARRTGI